MSLARGRFILIAEVAREWGVSLATLRRIATEQQKVSSTRISQRTLRRWPQFEKNPSGRWGISEAAYEAWKSDEAYRWNRFRPKR